MRARNEDDSHPICSRPCRPPPTREPRLRDARRPRRVHPRSCPLGRRAFGRFGSLLQVVGMLARSRRQALRVGGWIGASIAARFVGAVAIACALGLGSPASAALVLLVALGLAGVLPITPGNLGTGAGAAALALHSTGVGLALALATGVAFQAVETLVGLS